MPFGVVFFQTNLHCDASWSACWLENPLWGAVSPFFFFTLTDTLWDSTVTRLLWQWHLIAHDHVVESVSCPLLWWSSSINYHNQSANLFRNSRHPSPRSPCWPVWVVLLESWRMWHSKQWVCNYLTVGARLLWSRLSCSRFWSVWLKWTTCWIQPGKSTWIPWRRRSNPWWNLQTVPPMLCSLERLSSRPGTHFSVFHLVVLSWSSGRFSSGNPPSLKMALFSIPFSDEYFYSRVFHFFFSHCLRSVHIACDRYSRRRDAPNGRNFSSFFFQQTPRVLWFPFSLGQSCRFRLWLQYWPPSHSVMVDPLS